MKKLILALGLLAIGLQAADHADIPLWQRQLLSEMVKQSMDNSVYTNEPVDLQSPYFFQQFELIKQRSIVVEVYSSRGDWQAGPLNRSFQRRVDKNYLGEGTVQELKELILGDQNRRFAVSAIVANAPSPLQDHTKLKDIQSSTLVAWGLDAKELMAEEEQKKVAADLGTITISTPDSAPAAPQAHTSQQAQATPVKKSWCSKLCGNREKS